VRPDLPQELLVGQLRRIEVDLEHLGVVGEVLIRRVGGAPAGIADARANDRRVTPELGVGPPESTEAEHRGLGRRRRAVEWTQHASV
jgi:hypothetical protein